MRRHLSRQNLYIFGIAWGLGALFFSAIIAAPFSAAPASVRELSQDGSGLYHYHVSAILSVGLSFGVLAALGTASLSRGSSESLRRMFMLLIFLDMIAITSGAIGSMSVGWLKEIMDALQGRFADTSDLHGNVQGILAQAICACTLIFPPHIMAALFGDRMRWTLLRLLSPRSTRHTVDSASKIDERLHQNSNQLHTDRRCLGKLEREIEKLGGELASLAPQARETSRGSALAEALRKKEHIAEELMKRLAELETENEQLHVELYVLCAATELVPDGVTLVHEIHDLVGRCHRQSSTLAASQRQVYLSVDRIHATLGVSQIQTHAPLMPPSMTSPEDHGLSVREEEHAAAIARMQQRMALLLDEVEHRRVHEEEMTHELSGLRGKQVDMLHRLAEVDPQRLTMFRQAIDLLQRRVLVVDDDKPLRALYREVLENTGLIKVEVAGSALEATETMRQMGKLPDLILLDIRMPHINGTRFCAALERHPQMRHVPVIFCSAQVGDPIKKELAKLHHVDFIKKPAPLKQIEEAVLRALRINTDELPYLEGLAEDKA